MVIKREENINQSKKWNIYIKNKSILKKKLEKSNIEIKIPDSRYAHRKLVKTMEDIGKRYESGKANPKMIIINNELPKYEDNVGTWRRIKIIPFEKK